MKPLLRIFKVTAELKRSYIAIGALTVFVSLLALFEPYLTGKAIDEIGKGNAASIGVAATLAFLIFVTDVLRNFANNINGYIGDQVGAKIEKILSERYYEHLLHLPKSYFDNEQTGKIISKLERSVNEISSFINAMSNNFLQFIFTTIFALAVVAFYSIPVALLLTTLYPVYVWLTSRSSPHWMKYQKQVNEQRDIASGRFNESVSQIEVVKSYAQEKREFNFYRQHMQRMLEIVRPQSSYWHVQDTIRRLVLNVIFFAVFLIIFIQGVNGSLTPGQAVALLIYSAQIRIPIFTISFLVDRTQRAVSNSRDYFDVMEFPREKRKKTQGKQEHIKHATIAFEDVAFNYDGTDNQVISGMSFQVNEGKKVALVGKSGVGKSTLINLLMGLYAPTKGAITVGGNDIKTMSNDALRGNIAAVFQTPNLFSGTIKENISYANPDASQTDIEKAARVANAHEFITDLKDGYDSQIGERGIKLSGGQKQRISIARAVLKDAPILILDEATSSLDSSAEVEVQSALEKLMKNRTTIIIAHRLSTIQNVDHILVIENGQIIERGSPDELKKQNGVYAELLALQDTSSKVRAERFKALGINT